MPDTEPNYPLPTAQVAPYVDVLGTPLAIKFLILFGGAQVGLSQSPRGDGLVSRIIGKEHESALGQKLGSKVNRVPLASKWLALCLRAEGETTAEIARRLRVSDVSVRRWMAGTNTPRPPRHVIENR
jgi:hypothetical protein